MATTLIRSLFGEYFELFFVGFDWGSFDIDMFQGEARLKEIALRTQILDELIDIPFIKVKKALLSGLSIKYSLTSLKSEPIVISINKIELFLDETLTPQPLTRLLANFFDSKLKKKKTSGDSSEQYGFAEKIIDGLSIQIKEIIFTMQFANRHSNKSNGIQSAPKVRLHVQNISCLTTNHEWKACSLSEARRYNHTHSQFIHVFKTAEAKFSIHLITNDPHSSSRTKNAARILPILRDIKLNAFIVMRKNLDNSLDGIQIDVLINEIKAYLRLPELYELNNFLNSLLLALQLLQVESEDAKKSNKFSLLFNCLVRSWKFQIELPSHAHPSLSSASPSSPPSSSLLPHGIQIQGNELELGLAPAIIGRPMYEKRLHLICTFFAIQAFQQQPSGQVHSKMLLQSDSQGPQKNPLLIVNLAPTKGIYDSPIMYSSMPPVLALHLLSRSPSQHPSQDNELTCVINPIEISIFPDLIAQLDALFALLQVAPSESSTADSTPSSTPSTPLPSHPTPSALSSSRSTPSISSSPHSNSSTSSSAENVLDNADQPPFYTLLLSRLFSIELNLTQISFLIYGDQEFSHHCLKIELNRILLRSFPDIERAPALMNYLCTGTPSDCVFPILPGDMYTVHAAEFQRRFVTSLSFQLFFGVRVSITSIPRFKSSQALPSNAQFEVGEILNISLIELSTHIHAGEIELLASLLNSIESDEQRSALMQQFKKRVALMESSLSVGPIEAQLNRSQYLFFLDLSQIWQESFSPSTFYSGAEHSHPQVVVPNTAIRPIDTGFAIHFHSIRVNLQQQLNATSFSDLIDLTMVGLDICGETRSQTSVVKATITSVGLSPRGNDSPTNFILTTHGQPFPQKPFFALRGVYPASKLTPSVECRLGGVSLSLNTVLITDVLSFLIPERDTLKFRRKMTHLQRVRLGESLEDEKQRRKLALEAHDRSQQQLQEEQEEEKKRNLELLLISEEEEKLRQQQIIFLPSSFDPPQLETLQLDEFVLLDKSGPSLVQVASPPIDSSTHSPGLDINHSHTPSDPIPTPNSPEAPVLSADLIEASSSTASKHASISDLHFNCEIEFISLVSCGNSSPDSSLTVMLTPLILSSHLISPHCHHIELRAPKITALGLMMPHPDNPLPSTPFTSNPLSSNPLTSNPITTEQSKEWCSPFGLRCSIDRERGEGDVWRKAMSLELDQISLSVHDEQLSQLRQILEGMQISQLKQILIEMGLMDANDIVVHVTKPDSVVLFDRYKADLKARSLESFETLDVMMGEALSIANDLLTDRPPQPPISLPPPSSIAPNPASSHSSELSPPPESTIVTPLLPKPPKRRTTQKGLLGFSLSLPEHANSVVQCRVKLYEGGIFHVRDATADRSKEKSPMFVGQLSASSTIQTRFELDLCFEITQPESSIFLVAPNDEDFMKWMNACIQSQFFSSLSAIPEDPSSSSSDHPISQVAPEPDSSESVSPNSISSQSIDSQPKSEIKEDDRLERVIGLLQNIQATLASTKNHISSAMSETLIWSDDLILRQRVLTLEAELEKEIDLRQALSQQLQDQKISASQLPSSPVRYSASINPQEYAEMKQSLEKDLPTAAQAKRNNVQQPSKSSTPSPLHSRQMSPLPTPSPTTPKVVYPNASSPMSSKSYSQPHSSPQSSLKPQTSSLKPQTSSMKPQTSSLKPQTSSLKPQTSSLKPQTSSLKPQTSSLKPVSSAPSTASKLPHPTSTQPQHSLPPKSSSTQPPTSKVHPKAPTKPTSSTDPKHQQSQTSWFNW